MKVSSENAAGAISLIGSTAVMANSFDFDWSKLSELSTIAQTVSYNGDPTNLIAAASFTAGEISLMLRGHTTAGYSAGALGLAAGDAVLIFSDAAQGNTPLQISLAAMTAFWLVGASKYPLEKISERVQGNFKTATEKMANMAPKVCGFGNLGLRAPGIVTAAQGGNLPLAFGIACWATADILAGRLQDTVKEIYEKLISNNAKKPPNNDIS